MNGWEVLWRHDVNVFLNLRRYRFAAHLKRDEFPTMHFGLDTFPKSHSIAGTIGMLIDHVACSRDSEDNVNLIEALARTT